MEVGEDEHVIAIELDQQWDDDEIVPCSDNEIDSPPPIPNPSGSDDASDPELLEKKKKWMHLPNVHHAP